MADENAGFKHFPLTTEEGLDLLRRYSEELDAFRKEQAQLTADYKKRCALVAESRQAVLEDLWRKMAPLAGLDPNTTWLNREYQIETRYIESGFGAITFIPQTDPLAAIFGDAVRDDTTADEAHETVPEGTKLN